MTIGQRIRQIRQQRGYTQKKVAEACGMADSAIRKYESGAQVPRIETLQRIASALNVPVIELLGTVDEMDKQITEKLTDAKKSLDEGKGVTSDWEKRVKWAEAVMSASQAATLAEQRKISQELEQQTQDEMLNSFQKLNFLGQQEAAKRIKELSYVPDYKKEKTPPTAPEEAKEGE